MHGSTVGMLVIEMKCEAGDDRSDLLTRRPIMVQAEPLTVMGLTTGAPAAGLLHINQLILISLQRDLLSSLNALTICLHAPCQFGTWMAENL